jgi:CheY-like chemotaxis protein
MAQTHALIIDDNAENIEVLAHLLKGQGVTYTSLQTTRRLETTLEQMPPVDLVFLDIEMPDRNGYEVLKILRNYLGDQLVIIACTVYNSEMTKARSLGFNGFITKTLQMQQFSTQLAQILSGQAVWDAS